MSKRSPLAAFIAAVLLTGIAGAASAQTTTAPTTAPTADKVVFTIGTLTDMVSPNPLKATGVSDYETFMLAYDMLFNFSSADLTPTDGLAYWPPTHSADGKTWTFKIRSGVMWSDGTPLTAHDIAFTYNFINEKGLGAFKQELGSLPAKNAFEAPDDTTLIWHMAKPSLTPEHPPYVPIIPEHIWGKYMGDQYTSKDIKEVPNVPAVGSGPFVLTSWTQGQGWTMEANMSYWGGAPHVDEIDFRVYDGPEALKLALINGEIDAAEALPPGIFDQLQGQPNIATNVGPSGTMDDLAFNFVGKADPSLQNLDVRQAIAYSIDKQAIVDRVMLGYATPGNSVVLPQSARWRWQPDPTQVIGYDPAKAKTLLDQAGYKDVNGDGFRETPGGDPWTLEVLTISDWPNSVDEGKLIVGWMNDIGIKTTIKTVSTSKGYDLWYAQDFDMYVWGWTENVDPDFILSIFTSQQCGWWSDGCWKNATYDSLYQKQRTTISEADRQATVNQMQQMLYEQNPMVVLLYKNDLQAYRSDLFTDFVKTPQPQGYIFYGWSAVSEISVRPVSAASGSSDASSGGGGIPAWVWIALVVVAIVLIVVVMRRGKRSADKE